jgi:lysosomal acid lipase/cholesteryl ester hydrolase
MNKEQESSRKKINNQLDDSKPVVILQHGIMDSAACWLNNGRNSIAFKLVDNGFDVWLNNSRGSIYSLEHLILPCYAKGRKLLTEEQKQKVQKYYEFSFHELGIYDQPALWKFVMEQTKQDKLQYMCHSQGFT